MKKVIALMLAVLMLSTVAFAVTLNGIRYSDVTPGSTIKISRDGIKDYGYVTVNGELENGTKTTFIDSGKSLKDDISQYILRSVNSENYSVTNVKIQKVGKSLVKEVKINDKEDRVDIVLNDDLNNTNAKDFEVSFKLKGKVKFTIRDVEEVDSYNMQVASNKWLKDSNGKVLVADAATATALELAEGEYRVVSKTDADAVGKKVSLPDIEFNVVGTVGYGKVEVSLGDDGDEDFENLADLPIFKNSKYLAEDRLPNPRPDRSTNQYDYINIDNDVVKFVTGASGSAGNVVRIAGAYTADGILTQEYGDALTLEARVYKNDVLYFSIDNAPKSAIIEKLADVNADIDFYLFNEDKEFTTFNSTATLYFNDADEDAYVYEIVNNGLVPKGEYSEDDGCWILRTRTLGQYVVSDTELSLYEIDESQAAVDNNPDTGANDVVGIAAALAAVALVSAAAVSLKK